MSNDSPRRYMDDEVIVALTDGIGATLGRAVRRRYYELKKQLLLNDSYRRWDDDLREFAIDVLALSIFHRAIILPLDGAEGLWRQMQHFDVMSVKMRTTSYKSQDFERMKIIINRFFSILSKRNVAIELLTYESIDTFITSVERLKHRGSNEEEPDSLD